MFAKSFGVKIVINGSSLEQAKANVFNVRRHHDPNEWDTKLRMRSIVAL